MLVCYTSKYEIPIADSVHRNPKLPVDRASSATSVFNGSGPTAASLPCIVISIILRKKRVIILANIFA